MNREYNLKELFNEHVIVIPEMQRDYIWSITSDNVYKLLRNIDRIKHVKYNIGFIYAFKQDVYFSLIDGQQRLTTLVLLAFYLAVRENRWDDFKKMIASDGKLRFTYRVRKSTVDFMNDLFLSDCPTFDDIRSLSSTKWGRDTTIVNMIETLHIIDRYVQMNILTGNETRLSYDNVIRNVTFFYTDTDQTVQGREMYITMNCCGQPLSEHEMLKPYILKGENSIKKSTEWNKWEDWFYKLSKENGFDKNSVDIAMNNFLRIVYELISSKQCTEKWETDAEYRLSFDLVQTYFKALKRLHEYYPDMVMEIFEILTQNGNKKYYRKTKALLQVCYLNPVNLKKELDRMFHLVTMCLRAKMMENRNLLIFLRKYGECGMDLYSVIDKLPKDSTITSCIHEHEIRKIQIVQHGTKDTEKLLLEAEEIELLNSKDYYCLLNAIWDEKFSGELENWTDDDDTEFKKRIETFKYLFQHGDEYLSIPFEKGYISNAFLSRYLLSLKEHDYYIKDMKGWSVVYNLGCDEKWSDIFTNEYRCKKISTMLSNLMDIPDEEKFSVMQSSIDAAWQSYEGDHDARYYILKYENSLRAYFNGWNVIRVNNTYNYDELISYDIEIYSAPENSSSNALQMFESILAHAYPKGDDWYPVVNNGQFSLANGIDRHGWRIYYDKEMTRDSVIEYLRLFVQSHSEAMSLSPAKEEDDFVFVDIDKKHDLIEEGVSIMKHLEGISINI